MAAGTSPGTSGTAPAATARCDAAARLACSIAMWESQCWISARNSPAGPPGQGEGGGGDFASRRFAQEMMCVNAQPCARTLGFGSRRCIKLCAFRAQAFFLQVVFESETLQIASFYQQKKNKDHIMLGVPLLIA